MCQSMQLFIGRACCGSIEALWTECSEILAVPLTLWVAASVMVTCALSYPLFLQERSIGHSLRVDDTILAGDSSLRLGLMRQAAWVLVGSCTEMGTWGSLYWAGCQCCFTIMQLEVCSLWSFSLCRWCWANISDSVVSVDSVGFAFQVAIAAFDAAPHLLCNGSFEVVRVLHVHV